MKQAYMEPEIQLWMVEDDVIRTSEYEGEFDPI